MAASRMVDEVLTSSEAQVIKVLLGTVQEDVSDVKHSLKTMNESLVRLVQLQIEMTETRTGLTRAFDENTKVNDRVAELERRLRPVEVSLPGLLEARRWVVGLGITAVGMLLAALVSMVLITKNNGQAIVIPQAAAQVAK